MAPKRTSKRDKTFTLEQASKHFNSLPNAVNSIRNWVDALSTLVHYNEAENPMDTQMTKAEMLEFYKNVNILPIINNIDSVVQIIDERIISSRNNQPIATDTKKQYYLSIVRLTQKKSPCQISKDIRNKYIEKLSEIESLSNAKRNLNKPIRGNLEHPDWTWTKAVEEYNNYIDTHAFTRTKKGMKELRTACLVGFYILQRPRRLDYRILQYYSKKPSETDATDRNILYIDDGKMYVSLDVYKTRWRVQGQATEKKELLPRYIKEVNPKLASLLKDYIKKWEVKDISKLTPAEKRQKKEYYMFYKETGSYEEAYEDTTFSKYLSSCFKQVFNRSKLSVNSIRHIFNTHIGENLNQFNDAQLQQIAIDVGDTPKNLPTNLRYRIQHQENAELDKTQIEGNVMENEFIRRMVEQQGEEGASVGHNEDNVSVGDMEEVQSPSPNMLIDVSTNTELSMQLYQKLGEAHMQVKALEMLIQTKLGTK